jgi:corrinoid protein of di/trimethylamine methyltransferase
MTDNQQLFDDMCQAVLDGDEAAAARLAARSLEDGVPPLEAVDNGFVRGIRQAGELWEEGEFFLPELVTAAQAMKAAMGVLQPALSADAAGRPAGRVVIGTVQGDIHDIGKTLVGTLLAANGFEVRDLGADVPVDAFVAAAREIDASLVCASALLTTTMTVQRALIEALRAAGMGCPVLVGGAPVTADWAAEIGAAGYADSAVGAVERARRLMNAS